MLRQALGNHLLIADNVVQFFKNLASTRLYVDAYVVAFAGLGAALTSVGFQRRETRTMSIGIFCLFLLAGIINFALLNETRLYLICVPFVVFSTVAFSAEWLAYLGGLAKRSPRSDRAKLLR